MKDYKNIKMAFLVALIVLLTGCIVLLTVGSLTTDSISVYFMRSPDNQGAQLVAMDRRIWKSEDHLKLALTQLLAGPTQRELKRGFYTEIPKKTVLLGIKESPKEITINLSKDFEANGGSMSIMGRLEQLAFTVLDAAGDKPVYLELDGKRVEYLGGDGIEISQPLTR